MNIQALIEIIEPRVSTRNRSKEFTDKDEKGIQKTLRKSRTGSGNFSSVSPDKGDPHMVKKTSHGYMRSDTGDDAYWAYVDYIIKHQLWENPYFPRLYVQRNVKDPEGNVVRRVQMEKLVDVDDLNDKEFEALFANLLGEDFDDWLERSEYDKNTIVSRKVLVLQEIMNMIYDFITKGQHDFKLSGHKKSEINPQFIQALNTLRTMYLNDPAFGGLDLWEDNLMIRRSGHGNQLVFTDIFA